MIQQINFTNFRGQTKRYNLDNKNIITGRNEAGKSSIALAIEICLYGYARGVDGIDNKPNAIFDAYCGAEKSDMSISIVTDNGELKRVWNKDKNNHVSSKLYFNGDKIKQREDIQDMMGIKTFNISEFWGLPVNKRIARLCDGVIDPQKLDEIDQEIHEINSRKKVFDDELKKARQALADHMETLNRIGQPELSIDLSNKESRLKELVNEVAKAESIIREGQRSNLLLESNKQRAKVLQDELTNLFENDIEPYELNNINDIDKLREQKFKLYNLINKYDEKESILKELKKIEIIEPEQIDYTEQDIIDINKEIEKLQISGGSATSEDIAIVGFARKFSTDLKSLDIHDNCKTIVRKKLKENATMYLDRVDASENKENLKKTILNLKSKKDEITDIIYKNKILLKEYNLKQIEKNLLENKIKNIDIDFDKDEYDIYNKEYDDIVSKLNLLQMDEKKLKDYEYSVNSRKERIDVLTKELEKLSEYCSGEMVDLDFWSERQKSALKEQQELNELVREWHNYEYQKKIANDKSEAIDELQKNVKTLIKKEQDLHDEKAFLLKTLKEKVEDKVNLVIHPSTVDIQINGGRNGYINFYISMVGGKTVLREVASGAQRCEFDLALSSALLDCNGLVISEVSELDEQRMKLFLNKVSKIDEKIQVLLIGHSIAGFNEKDFNCIEL